MANTYTLIASSTVGSGGVADITFSSIPSTYTDLKIVASIRVAEANEMVNFYARLNGNSSSYTTKRLYGTGSAAASDNQPDTGAWFTAGIMPAATATSNTFGNLEIYIPNYLSSNHKSASIDAVAENNATLSFQVLGASLWSNTAAITSVTLLNGSNNILEYSTAYLYGISSS